MQMTEAPPTIPVGLESMFIAKAIERIGDHATNIAEFVVYVVKGRDVRHVSLDRLEGSLGQLKPNANVQLPRSIPHATDARRAAGMGLWHAARRCSTGGQFQQR
jgi:phosphate transport system protein